MGGGNWAAAEDQRNTLLMDWRKEVEELGMEAERRELARSVSTAALRRYAMAVRLVVSRQGLRERGWLVGG
jgi:hypothetical protein